MKKRVLYITNLPASYKIDFFNELSKYVDLTVIFERQTAGNRSALWNGSFHGASFRTIWLKGIRLGDEMSFSFRIVSLLKNLKYDIVMMNGYSSPSAMLAIAYLKFKHIPYVIVCDGLLYSSAGRLKQTLKHYLLRSAKLYLSSGKITDRVLVESGADATRIFRYPFTSVSEKAVVDVPYDRRVYKARVGCTAEYMVLYVGQMIHRKGIDTLQEAMTGIQQDAALYMIGGTHSPLLKPDDKVTVLDFMKSEDLAEYYKAADVLVLPSREDIWGLVVNEAFAYGVPVISTTNCGAALAMIDHDNGAIVAPEDAVALRTAISRFLNHEHEAQYMNAAHHTALAYTIEKMASVTYEVLEKNL